MTSLSVHDVRKIEVRAIEDFDSSATGKPWCTRRIVAHDKDGRKTEIVLFGDSRDDLLMPGESVPEAKIVSTPALELIVEALAGT